MGLRLFKLESTSQTMQTPQKAYVFKYPQAVEFAEKQNEAFWLAGEIAVEKDVQDIMVNMTESERHGVMTTLKLFTLYELIAGGEYWGERVMKMFPRPCIQMMASSFAFFELNVHAPFYNKLNEALRVNTEEFYLSYLDDPILKERMDFVDSLLNDKDDLVSLGAFTMVEGVVLYSAFAFLKHFQSNGKNKITNVVRGISFSVRDENLHALGGAWLYNELKADKQFKSKKTLDFTKVEDKLIEAAHQIFEHEEAIIDMLFSKGPIEGITPVQMKHFVQSRINLCLKEIGIGSIFEVSYNPIATWFYKGINAYQMNDFFTGIGNQYTRGYDEKAFEWVLDQTETPLEEKDNE